jgi:hypothetical protein
MDDKYWDSEEYDFFNSLGDNEKLLYVYELLSDYVIDDYDFFEDEFDDEFDEELDGNYNELSKNKLIISSMDSIKLSGDKIDTIKEIAEIIMMNGLLMRVSDTAYFDDGSVLLTYNIIGKSYPICLN